MNETVASGGPELYLEIGGVKRRLRLTLHSLAQLKKLTGKSFLKGELDSRDPGDLVALMWATMIADSKEFDGGFPNGQADEKIQAALALIGGETGFEKLEEFNRLFLSLMPAKKTT